MKKILAIILSIMFAVTVFILPASADEAAAYSEDELKETLRAAFELYSDFFEGFYEFDYDAGVVNLHFDPDPEYVRNHYARRLDKFRMWDDFMSALDAAYADSVREVFLRKVDATERDGYTYSCTVYSMAQGKAHLLDREEEVSLDDSFEIISSKDGVVTASFDIADGISLWDPEVKTYTVEFTYENGAWRVSGGRFVDEFIAARGDSHFYSGTAPLTGDNGFICLGLAFVSAMVISMIRRRHV